MNTNRTHAHRFLGRRLAYLQVCTLSYLFLFAGAHVAAAVDEPGNFYFDPPLSCSPIEEKLQINGTGATSCPGKPYFELKSANVNMVVLDSSGNQVCLGGFPATFAGAAVNTETQIVFDIDMSTCKAPAGAYTVEYRVTCVYSDNSTNGLSPITAKGILLCGVTLCPEITATATPTPSTPPPSPTPVPTAVQTGVPVATPTMTPLPIPSMPKMSVTDTRRLR